VRRRNSLIAGFWFSNLIVLLVGFAYGVYAEPEKSYTLSTSDKRFQITTPHLSLTHQLLLTSEQAGKDFEVLMGGKEDWKYPIHITIVSGKEGFRRQIKVFNKDIIFMLTASQEALAKGEFFSALGELLCYELSVRGLKNIRSYEELPILDFWMMDGVGQCLNRSYHEDYWRIVKGVVKRQAAPTLLTVHSWDKPSDDILERWLQKAFNFWLVRQLTFRKKDRDLLGDWLRQTSQLQAEKTIYWTNMMTGGKWWSTALRRNQKQPHEIFLDFETTQQRLEEILKTEFKKDGTNYFLTEWHEAPRNSELFLLIKNMQQALWQLMERADAFYQPVVMAYYQAISSLSEDKKGEEIFLESFAVAKDLSERTKARRQEINDYLNWFEVTQFPLPPEIEFYDYFMWKSEEETLDAMLGLKLRAQPFSILSWQR
jgi:hypothetical protein